MITAEFRCDLWVIKMDTGSEREVSLQEWWHWCGGKAKIHMGLQREKQQVCGAVGWCCVAGHICLAEVPVIDLNSTENPNIIAGTMYFDFVPSDL